VCHEVELRRRRRVKFILLRA